MQWLTVGKLSDHNGDVDRAKLLSKLQTLVLRLDKSNSNRQLPSVEAAKDYLQEVRGQSFNPSNYLKDHLTHLTTLKFI